jgi:F0F1-type ATP synthase membrane subunit b/b'
MPNTLESILMSGLGVVTAGLVFLYKANTKTLEDQKKEYQGTISKILADAQAERATCQVENEKMREDINKLQEQLIDINREYGKLSGKLAVMEGLVKQEAKP